MNENFLQPVVLVLSIATVPVWVAVGRFDRRVGWYAALPVIVVVLTALYYVMVLFTDLNDLYQYSFVLLSTWLRLFVEMLLFFGGVLMLARAIKRNHE